MYKCKHCQKEFQKGQQLGGHITHCKLNPDYEKIQKEKSRKLSIANTGRKVSEATKKKISKGRVLYLKNNPDKVPYLINHSSCISYPEKVFKRYLIEYKITGWIHRMQFSIYEIDFAFPEYKLAVEIDGGTHKLEKVIKIDKRRDLYLESQGWTTLRITAKSVKNNVYECINLLQKELGNKLISIPKEFLNKRYIKEELIREKIQNKLETEKLKSDKINILIEKIKNSNIDFKKIGWVQSVSNLTNIRHQRINVWMKKNMPEFYKDCYKRSSTLSASQ